MRNARFWTLLFAAPLLLLAVGCETTIPARLEVRDVGTGKAYTTYQPWGTIDKGIGYQFTDIETGNRITLTNYELKTLEASKSVANGSAEAQAYAEAAKRGGIK